MTSVLDWIKNKMPPGEAYDRAREADSKVAVGWSMEHLGPVDTGPRFLKLYQAAAFCNMNRRTFSIWSRRHRVPYVPMGTGKKHKLYDKKDLENKMASLKVVSGAPRRMK